MRRNEIEFVRYMNQLGESCGESLFSFRKLDDKEPVYLLDIYGVLPKVSEILDLDIDKVTYLYNDASGFITRVEFNDISDFDIFKRIMNSSICTILKNLVNEGCTFTFDTPVEVSA